METSRNKQFISFKLCAVLSSVKKSFTILLGPARGANRPSAQHLSQVLNAAAQQELSSGSGTHWGACNASPADKV